jgi:hypothetical protein
MEAFFENDQQNGEKLDRTVSWPIEYHQGTNRTDKKAREGKEK